MDLGLFGGWASMAGALIEAVILYPYAVLVLRVAGKTTVGTARVFDFVSTPRLAATRGHLTLGRGLTVANR